MTAVDWEEVKRLAADFQRAQLTSTSQTLSERNCVEVITKLIQLNLLDVIFTTDGKEYITPQYLVKEIKDELYVNGGRVNLVELSKSLNVDLSHISTRISEVEKTTSGCTVIMGQLINKTYQRTISEEINDRLQKSGQVVVSDLTKVYDLPGDFLQSVIERNLGKVIFGKQDKSDSRVFYTEAFVEKNKSILRGALRALTRPTQVSVILNLTQLEERNFYAAFDSLVETKESCGVLTARQGGNSSFIPHVYTKQQTEWVDNFYKQNGYLEYDAMSRLGISDPISFVKRHYPNVGLLELPSCAIGSQLLDQVEAAVEETLITGSYLDIMMLLPSIFGPSDVSTVIERILKKNKNKAPAHIFCDTVLVTETFLRELCQPFYNDGVLQEKANQSIHNGTYIQAQTEKKLGKSLSLAKEDLDSKTEKREERRKKAAGGKTGGGTQGRETKTKSTKNKKVDRRGRGDALDDSESDSEVTKKPQLGKLEFLNEKEIMKALKSNQLMQDLLDVDGIIEAVAKYLHPILNKRGMELAAEAFERTLVSSAGERKRTHGDLQNRVDNWLTELRLVDRGIKLFPNEDTRIKLTSFLLKSTGAELVNALILYGAEDSGTADVKEFTPQIKSKMLAELSGEIKETVTVLNKAMSGNSVDDFLNLVEPALTAVGLLSRKPDKKKERQFLLSKRENLLTEVGRSDNPSVVLLNGVLLIFQTATQTALSASGKFIPSIITFLRPHLSPDLHALLHKFQDFVLKLLIVGEDAEAEAHLKSELNELLPKVKEEITSYRKQSVEKNV